MSKFQITVLGIFVVCIVAGVIGFATYKSNQTSSELAPITIWGTFSASIFNEYIADINLNREQPLKISYIEIPESNFDKTFIESLARGEGPDAILIPQDLILKHQDKIIQIPYSNFPQRDYKDTFIQQGELYMTSNGLLALPYIIDPMIMYWNRDIFTNAGIVSYPKYWDEFTDLNKKITQKDFNSNIRKSAIAMGEFNNISNAREILGTLLFQVGNPVSYRDSEQNISSAIGDSSGFSGLNSAIQAVNFFTEFSDSRNTNYSWNRSLPISKSYFISGNLATYFGFASEINDIRQKNPNIDFDIAPMPQIRQQTGKALPIRATYGSMYGFSIVRSTKSSTNTFSVITALLSQSTLDKLIKITYLPPVRKDMIKLGTDDQYLTIFYDSAIISKGWLDKGKVNSNKIFQDIIESVSSGRKDINEALRNGNDEYDILLKSI